MPRFRPSARTAALPPNFFGALDRRVARAVAAGVPVIDVSKGNPDLPTPEHIVREMQAQVADPANHRYPAFSTRRALGSAIAARYLADHGVRIDPDVHVAAFHGSHEALMAAVLSLADPGANVVLPDPGYPAYSSAVLLAEARTVPLPLRRDGGYQPDFAALDGVADAAVLLLNYPNNPTGALATRATFAAAAVVAERLGAAVVHDFAYASLGFDGRTPLSALSVDRELAHTVEVSTLSKTYSMAGWRLGYAVGNPSIIEAMRRYQAQAFSTIFGATQEAAAAALAGDQSAAAELVGVYERRRDLVVAGLRAIGWDPAPPEGSFFVWLPVPGGGDDVAFAERLLDEAGVAVAPGSGFGEGGRGFVRLSLVRDEATLTALVERLAALVPAPAVGASP